MIRAIDAWLGRIPAKLLWWLIFLGCLFPVLNTAVVFIWKPRALGIDPVETLLAWSGIWALRFLLITLAISPLRRLGLKRLARFRRMLGLYAFFYATLHFSLYIGGWLQFDWAALVEDLLKRSFIYFGFAVWLVLLCLAVTSPKAMVKKLKKTWSRIHWLIYPAAMLAWWHFWQQTRVSAAEPLLYLTVLVVLFSERLIDQKRKKQRKVEFSFK